MKIYHIELAKTGLGLSGGEVCTLKLIRYFSSQGYENILITTDNGQTTYSKELRDDVNVRYLTISSFKNEQKYGVFVSYILRLFRIRGLLRRVDSAGEKDLVICHSEFFPNSISMWFFVRKFKNISSMAFYHMKAPSLFKGYEGEYTNRYQFPRLTIAHYRLNQWLYRLLTHKKTIILTVNQYYQAYLESKYPKNRVSVLKHYGGTRIRSDGNHDKYDLIWVGRFHRQKGLLDFVDVVQRVKRAVPNIRSIVVGGGDDEILRKFKDEVHSRGLEDNIKYAGFLTGESKDECYLSARIFVMTSYYESFGQVILESASHDLPVVAYALPVYSIFEDKVLQVDILNNENMASELVELLSSPEKYRVWVERSRELASNHSWELTGQQILDELKSVK